MKGREYRIELFEDSEGLRIELRRCGLLRTFEVRAGEVLDLRFNFHPTGGMGVLLLGHRGPADFPLQVIRAEG